MKFKSITIYAILLVCTLELFSQPASISNLNVLGAEFGNYEVKINKSNLGKFSDSREEISLSGAWSVQLDRDNNGHVNGWQKGLTQAQPIQLPGSLDDAKIGTPEPLSQTRFTRKFKYLGAAWYEKEIFIPETWKNKEITLWLDRVMWESRVYIDGNIIGSEESLSTPHVYNLGTLTPGKHKMVIRIDNAGRAGASCHGYGTDIQTQWNGVIGKMALIARDKVFISEMNIYPDIATNSVTVVAKVKNNTGIKILGEFAVAIHKMRDTVIIAKKNAWLRLSGDEFMVNLRVPLKDTLNWSEFNPSLYEASAVFVGEGDAQKCLDSKTVGFGMREIVKEGKKLLLNNQPIYLRGTNDAAGFPMVGYIPTDKKSWTDRFMSFKKYGLNHVRFHSVCPPEGAFEAADELGIYLQVELPYWGSVNESWEGTAFLQRELDKIVAFYGNHPSFCMLTMGNEHDGDFDYLDKMTERIKKFDNRHLVAAVSNPYIRRTKQQQSGKYDDFCAIMWGDDLKGKRNSDRIRYMERLADGGDIERDKDYFDLVAPFPVPFIGHELGQFWIYPDFKKVEKYNGVLNEGNLITFRNDVQQKGLMPWADEFCIASGKEAIQLYKEDIERFLRTSNTAGYQLLDVRDYPGQGTALVGALFDCFGDEKNHVTVEEFKTFCAPVVLLARIPKITYVNGDSINIPIEVFNYSQDNINHQTLEWTIKSQNGKVIHQGVFTNISAPKGGNTSIGIIKALLNINRPEELTIEVKLKESLVFNHWKIWTFLSTPKVEKGVKEVKVVSKMDDETLNFVFNGGRVLYLGVNQDVATQASNINAIWTPLMLENRTCGALINNKHPLFKDFPTSTFSDLLWMNVLKKSSGFILNATPTNYTPIVWAIECPSAMRNAKAGTITEMSYGKGVILATTLHLEDSDVAIFPEARQLKQSMLNYLASANSSKIPVLSKDVMVEIFYPALVTFLKEPNYQSKKLMEIFPMVNAKPMHNSYWKTEFDKVEIQNKLFNYRLSQTSGEKNPVRLTVKEGGAKSWDLSKKTLEIDCPQNFSGKLYLKLNISSNAEGFVDFYPYTYKIKSHGNDNYMCINIIPKMIIDGKVRLNFANPNIPFGITHVLLTE
jgi:hypothetical protein